MVRRIFLLSLHFYNSCSHFDFQDVDDEGAANVTDDQEEEKPGAWNAIYHLFAQMPFNKQNSESYNFSKAENTAKSKCSNSCRNQIPDILITFHDNEANYEEGNLVLRMNMNQQAQPHKSAVKRASSDKHDSDLATDRFDQSALPSPGSKFWVSYRDENNNVCHRVEPNHTTMPDFGEPEMLELADEADNTNVATIRTGITQVYICIRCGSTFSSRFQAKEHTFAVHGAREDCEEWNPMVSYSCFKCDLAFQSKQALNEHNRHTHTSFWRKCLCC